MDFTGFGWSVFWIFAIGAALFAYAWTRSSRRRTSQAPKLYMEALRALVDGDDHTAFERLKMTANEDSGNIDAYLKLGDLLRKRGKFDRAIRVHEELTLRLGLSKSAQIAVHKALAQDYLAAANHQLAESSLLKILEIDKEHLWAATQLVSLYESTGRFDEAYEARKTALKISGQKDGQSLALYKTLAGTKLAAQGKKHEARVEYKEALSHDPNCIPALLYLGDAYWEDGRADEAVEWWTRLASAHTDAAHLVFGRLERAYFELGQYGEITKFYDRILEKNPNNTAALIGLADLARKKGEYDRAIQQYRHVMEIDSDNVAARAGIISALARMNRWPQVASEVEHLLDAAAFSETDYICSKCGHREHEATWYCAKCKGVGTFRLWSTSSQSATTKV
jgi:lipopolysaccharide biosynthesis regulator YciM